MAAHKQVAQCTAGALRHHFILHNNALHHTARAVIGLRLLSRQPVVRHMCQCGLLLETITHHASFGSTSVCQSSSTRPPVSWELAFQQNLTRSSTHTHRNNCSVMPACHWPFACLPCFGVKTAGSPGQYPTSAMLDSRHQLSAWNGRIRRCTQFCEGLLNTHPVACDNVLSSYARVEHGTGVLGSLHSTVTNIQQPGCSIAHQNQPLTGSCRRWLLSVGELLFMYVAKSPSCLRSMG